MKKSSVVLISSDDDDDEELESHDESDYSDSDDQEYDGDDYNDDDDNDDDDDDDDYNDNDDDDDDYDNDDDDEAAACFDNRNQGRDRFHQGSNDLQKLSNNECKQYLRKHGLRLSGTKDDCLQQINEHRRLKDGRGESLYPRSLFSINCTGDACKGDVLFRQKVQKKQGNIVGKRTVAGRIVKESYGASKQQHTFTVEVLWSKPFKNLPPLSTLLVKGRKLYKFGTFKQPWSSEAERSKVLGEKHSRGDAARHKRTLTKTDITSNNDKGRKRQKLSHEGPSQSKQKTRVDKQKSAKRRGTAPVKKNTKAHKKHVQFQKTQSKRSIQPTFHSYPNHSIYPDHSLQHASSSSLPYHRTLLPNFPSFGFSGNNIYNNGYSRPNHNNIFQPPGYHDYNHEELIPRYRLS